MNINRKHLGILLSIIPVTLIGSAGLKIAARKTVDKVHDDFVYKMTTDLYDENVWELISSTTRVGIQEIIETDLRAHFGEILKRPLGSPAKFPTLDDLKFNIAQLHTMPTELATDIDVKVTIGKTSKKPFTIDNPLMVAPMAYGIAVSKKTRIALARGSAMAGTANFLGQGVFFPEERNEAKYLIFSYHRGHWGKTPEIIQQCDGVEIQFGQGATGGAPRVKKSKFLDKHLEKEFNIPKGEDAVVKSRHADVQHPDDLIKLVDRLKDMTGGVPVGTKIGAGKHLEADLYWSCKSGADFVVVEGAEAATHGSSPILQDSFGTPTIFAIHRAAQWLKNNGYKDRVSLIASGKIRNPSDTLKACALGADACYMGAIPLFAISAGQVTKAMPFEPPTSLLWYGAKHDKDFDMKKGAMSLFNFFQACNLELMEAIRVLGKTSLSQVDINDLFSINEMISKGCNIPMAYEPYYFEQN